MSDLFNFGKRIIMRSVMIANIFTLIAVLFFQPGNAWAQTVDELKKLLEEKDRLISDREKSIARLKKELVQLKPKTIKNPSQSASYVPAGGNRRSATAQPNADKMTGAQQAYGHNLSEVDNDDVKSHALERTLILEGAAVLNPWQVQLVPEVGAMVWDRERQTNVRHAEYAQGQVAMGLPWQSEVRVSVPYYRTQTSSGHGFGFGDLSFSLTKQVLSENEYLPNVVVSAGSMFYLGNEAQPRNQLYVASEDIDKRDGFQYNGAFGSITATKRFDPLVLIAGAYAGHGIPQSILGTRLNPGNYYGGRFGALLAITPSTSINTMFDIGRVGIARNYDNYAGLAIADSLRGQASILDYDAGGFPIIGYRNGEDVLAAEIEKISKNNYRYSSTVTGAFSFGVSHNLTKSLLLQVTANMRLLGPAPNFGLSVALPYYFQADALPVFRNDN